jgi:hypothetical protein
LVPDAMCENIGTNPTEAAAAKEKKASPLASSRSAKKTSRAAAPDTADSRRGAR